MTGFIDQMAARAQGYQPADRPRVHLRRRSRYEPPPVPHQRVTSAEPAARASTIPPAPPRSVPAEQPVETPSAPPPPARRRDDASPAIPDPLVVVREKVVPELVEAGVLEADEQPAVVDAENLPAAVEPVDVQLRVESPRYSAPPVMVPDRESELPANPPDIHVHIDRIEVVRPQAKPAPPPPPRVSRPRGVDHGEYLARRRDRR